MREDKIEAGPVEILYKDDNFMHEITIQPSAESEGPDTEPVEIIRFTDGHLLDVTLHKVRKGICRVEVAYRYYVGPFFQSDPLDDEPPIGPDDDEPSLDTDEVPIINEQ